MYVFSMVVLFAAVLSKPSFAIRDQKALDHLIENRLQRADVLLLPRRPWAPDLNGAEDALDLFNEFEGKVKKEAQELDGEALHKEFAKKYQRTVESFTKLNARFRVLGEKTIAVVDPKAKEAMEKEYESIREIQKRFALLANRPKLRHNAKAKQFMIETLAKLNADDILAAYGLEMTLASFQKAERKVAATNEDYRDLAVRQMQRHHKKAIEDNWSEKIDGKEFLAGTPTGVATNVAKKAMFEKETAETSAAAKKWIDDTVTTILTPPKKEAEKK